MLKRSLLSGENRLLLLNVSADSLETFFLLTENHSRRSELIWRSKNVRQTTFENKVRVKISERGEGLN